MNTGFLFPQQQRKTFLQAAAAFALGVSLLFSGAAAAQVYKCTGDYGRVTYRDEPCDADAQQTDVDVRANVIETSTDVGRVQRNPTQLERENARRGKQKRTAAQSVATENAATKQTDISGTPEHQRRLRAQQRRIRGQQAAQQRRVTPHRQR